MSAYTEINSNEPAIPESFQPNSPMMYLDSLKQLPANIYSYLVNNPGRATIYVVGTVIICFVCGGVYVVYANPALQISTKAGILSCSTAISTSIANTWTCLRETIAIYPYTTAAIGAAVMMTPTTCLFQSWRRQQADAINANMLNIPHELALRIHDDDVLGKYICPLALVPSMKPVKVQQGGLVWYFDQDLLLSWYDRCRSAGRVPYNPLTMQPLSFTTREDIAIDEDALRTISKRMAVLAKQG
jgi:hypothetical protein